MSDSIADAFINVRARDGGLHDDVKNMGEKAGAAGGEAGGKTFGDKFTETGAKELARDSNGRFTAAGEKTGGTFADGFTRGADGKLRDAKGRFAGGLGGSGGGSGGSGGGSFWDKLGSKSGKEFSGGLGKALKVGFVGIGGTALGASGLNSLGVLTAGTAMAVKQLSGSLLLLPAAGAAAAISIGTLKIGTQGLGDAFSALASGDSDAFVESLRHLTPEAQQAVTAVSHLTPAVSNLRKAVQSRLFADIGPQIGELGGKYLPIAAAGFGKTAEAVNRAGLTLADFLGHTRPLQQTSDIFDHTAEAAGNLRHVLPSVVSALLDVTQAGSTFLPQGAKSFDEAAQHLAASVDHLAKTGQLKEYIGGGLDAAKALVSVLGNAGEIIANVFKAGGAGNDAPLQTLAVLLGHVADQIGRPEFQKGLGDVFAAIAYAAHQVDGALPDVADALVALAPALDHLVRGSGDAFATTLEIIAGTAKAAAPALDVLAAVLDHFGPAIGVALAGLLALKGGLVALEVVGKVRGNLVKLDGALGAVDASGKKAGTAMGGLAAASKVIAVVGISQAISDIGKEMFTTTVKTKDLAKALDGLGSGADPGKGLSDLFGTGGLFGQTSNIDASSKALDQFATNAKHALDPDLFRRVLKDGSGDALTSQITQLDKAFASLVQNGHADQAAASFKKFIDAAAAKGVDPADLAQGFTGYAKAIAAAGVAAGQGDPKIAGFNQGIGDAASIAKIADNSLRSLTATTIGYANAVLQAQGDQASFEQAIDDAHAAIKRNGQTLDLGTQKGRDNAAALREIASAGIAIAKDVPEGTNAQKHFAETMAQTREQYVAAAIDAGKTTAQANKLATAILGVPSHTVRLAGNVDDLKEKIDDAKHRLKDKGLTDPQKSKIRGDIADLKAKLAAAEAALDAATRSRTVNITAHLSGLNAVRSAIGSTAPGARASGGPVFKGTTYLVGEKGPELFTAAQTGTILSAGATKRAALGLDDLSRSRGSQRESQSMQPAGVQYLRLHPDDIARLGKDRPIRLYLDTGQLVGSIDQVGGQTL